MAVLIDSLVKSWVSVRKNWRAIPLIAALDLAFFFFVGVLNSIFTNSAGPSLTALMSEVGASTADVSLAIAQQKSGIAVLLSNPIIMSNLKSFALVGLLSFAALYLLWILLQNFAWSSANKMINKNNKDYFSSFSKTSLFWFAVVLIFFILLTLFSLVNQLRISPLMPSSIIEISGLVVSYILIYFAFISISLTPMRLKQNLKKTFSSGIKNIYNFIVVYAAIFLVLTANFQITYFLFKSFITGASFVSYFFIILRIIIALPFLAWARVYLIETIKQV